MGQIIGGAAKPKRCNISQLSQLGTPAAGEHILVSTDNSAMQNGQGNFDAYVVGDGTTPAPELELKSIDEFSSKDKIMVLGGTIGIENFTIVPNTNYSKNYQTGVVSTSTSSNIDTYKIEWRNGGVLHVKLGGSYALNDMMVGFFNSTTLETSTLIYSANTNNKNTVFETTIPIPQGTVEIVVCNRKINLAAPIIEILYDGLINSEINALKSSYNYGVEGTTKIALSNGTTLIDGFAVTANHTYKVTTRKITAGASNVLFAMGSNDEIGTLLDGDAQVFLFIPKTSSASCRLYSKSSVSTAYEYYWKIEDVTTPTSMPFIDTNDGVFLTPSEVIDNLDSNETTKPLSANQGKIIGDYLYNKYDNFVYKKGQMPVRTTAAITFVDGFEVVAGHVYKVRLKTSAQVGVTFSVGLGSNGTFSNISSSTDTTTDFFEQTKTASTSSSNSRIYFQYGSEPSSYPEIEIYLYDVTQPDTLPLVIVSEGLETRLERQIENIQGGGGIASSSSLHLGTMSVGLWSLNGKSTSAGMCSDKMVYPWNNMTIEVKLPSSLSCQILTGTNLSMLTASEWLNDGDTYDVPKSNVNHKYPTVTSGESYYAVNITDANNHSICSASAETLAEYIKAGVISLNVAGKETSLLAAVLDSDRYVRQRIDVTKPIIVHVTDVHGDRTRYNRALDYADSINASMLINTGDSVSYNWTDGCQFVVDDAFAHRTPVCCCIGNHDIISTSANILFNQIISPLTDDNNYLQSAGTPAANNYYYVDDTAKSIRYIVLSVYFGAGYDATQIDWFVSTLASTPAGYGVIIALHTLDKRGVSDAMNDGTPGEFTSWNLRGIVDLFISGSSGSVTVYSSNSVSCDFTNAASHEFICWMAGHSHVDFVGHYDDTTNRQVVLQADCTCSVQSYTTLPRDLEGCVQDSFNIYQIDRSTHKILVMKVGSNKTTTNVDITTAEVSYV